MPTSESAPPRGGSSRHRSHDMELGGVVGEGVGQVTGRVQASQGSTIAHMARCGAGKTAGRRRSAQNAAARRLRRRRERGATRDRVTPHTPARTLPPGARPRLTSHPAKSITHRQPVWSRSCAPGSCSWWTRPRRTRDTRWGGWGPRFGRSRRRRYGLMAMAAACTSCTQSLSPLDPPPPGHCIRPSFPLPPPNPTTRPTSTS
jgi:hypothetical protein